MKTTFRVKAYHSARSPKLKALVVWKDGAGKYQKKFFHSQAEAKTYAQQREIELMNQGKEVLNFPSWLRIMAQEAQARLAQHGKNIREATDFYLSHLARSSASKAIEEAVREYLLTKKERGLSRDYYNHLNSFLIRFAQTVPGKLLSDIKAEDCRAWLRAHQVSAHSRNQEIKTLSAFFAWGKARRYCSGENPLREIEFFKEVETPVGILQPAELSALLNAANPQMLAYVAIGAFAGLRVAELQRLDWSEIDFVDGFIEVKAAKSKTAQRRLVKIQPCLRAWIEPIAKASGRIVNIKHAWRDMVDLRERAGLAEWPKNALRHSFASYHLARWRNAAELALEMGHTGTGMIFAHYRQVVKEGDAARYWSVLPEQPENVLQIALQNTDELKSNVLQTRDPFTHKYAPREGANEYSKTPTEYAAIYQVTIQCICKWIRQGRPLDDRPAMEALWRGEYQSGVEHYARLYKTTKARAQHWMRAGWPLDNVEAMQRYLGHVANVESAREQKKAHDIAKIITLTPKGAAASANDEMAAARRA